MFARLQIVITLVDAGHLYRYSFSFSAMTGDRTCCLCLGPPGSTSLYVMGIIDENILS